MAQDYRPGEIVPQSGVYTITHDPVHADMPHGVTVIKGRRFPTCRHCKGVRFELRPRGQARLGNRAFRRRSGAGFQNTRVRHPRMKRQRGKAADR